MTQDKTISSDGGGEQIDGAVSDLMKEGQRIHDFIERLDRVIADAVRNAQTEAGV